MKRIVMALAAAGLACATSLVGTAAAQTAPPPSPSLTAAQ